MNTVRLLGTAILLIGMVNGVPAEKKKAEDSKAMLVGTWETVRGDLPSLPAGSSLEFTKDGAAKSIRKAQGQLETLEGAYTVAGDKLTLTRKIGTDDLTSTLTIKKLTATELTLERDGKTADLKRK